MKRGDSKKGKVWKGMMQDQFYKDFSHMTQNAGKKNGAGGMRKKPKRVY